MKKSEVKEKYKIDFDKEINEKGIDMGNEGKKPIVFSKKKVLFLAYVIVFLITLLIIISNFAGVTQ